MESNEGVQDYMRRTMVMAEQLKNIGVNLEDSLVAAKIVAGLPSKFSSFISIWNSLEESRQTLVNLEQRLVSEELMLNRYNDDSGTALTAARRTQRGGYYSRRGRFRSFNQQSRPNTSRPNETESSQNQAFNRRQEERPQTSKEEDPVQRNQCRRCRQFGHLITFCPQNRRGYSTTVTTDSNEEPPSAIVAETNCVQSNGVWILDSGASEDMVSGPLTV